MSILCQLLKVVIFNFILLPNCFGQNLSYRIFSDSIDPIAETDYKTAKEIYIKYQKKYKYDPLKIHSFLRHALANKDIPFFKKEALQLMGYGYRFQYSDTLAEKRNNELLYALIYENKLNTWLVTQSANRYPKYLKTHPNAIEYEKFMASLLARDQLIVNYSSKLTLRAVPILKQSKIDTLVVKKVDSVYSAIFREMDFSNILEIVNLCGLNKGRLPTNFDCPYLARYMELAYFHVMKNSGGTNLILTWEMLHPYFEDAYIRGEINDAFFSTYDHYLEEYFDQQYYGTRASTVTIRDPETYRERKARLGL